MSIKDAKGNEFVIHVNTASLIRVREDTELDLLRCLEDQSTLAKLFSSIELQTKVFYALCKNQVKDQCVTLEQWQENWNGDALDEALEELMEGLARFFPKRKGTALRAGVKSLRTFLGAVYEKATVKAEAIDVNKIIADVEKDAENKNKLTPPEPEKEKSDQEQQLLVGNSSEPAQQSSDSTPVRTPPTNSSL